jgi:tetrahydromethanopterin S-methyltransferase subunit B
MTKQEVKEIAITAPITGYVSAAGTVVDTDTILEAIEKLNGNITNVANSLIPATTGNNLFNFYNFY